MEYQKWDTVTLHWVKRIFNHREGHWTQLFFTFLFFIFNMRQTSIIALWFLSTQQFSAPCLFWFHSACFVSENSCQYGAWPVPSVIYECPEAAWMDWSGWLVHITALWKSTYSRLLSIQRYCVFERPLQLPFLTQTGIKPLRITRQLHWPLSLCSSTCGMTRRMLV